jgi:HSP20 family protein
MHKDMREVLSDMMSLSGPRMTPVHTDWIPETDIYETEDQMIVVVNLAGVQKEDIEVSFYDRHLQISGTRKLRSIPGKPSRYHQLELARGDFERFVRLPKTVDPDGIHATCADGLLTVRLNKKKAAGPVRIDVNS